MSATTTCPTCDADLRARGTRFLVSIAIALVIGVAIGVVLRGAT
jgi:hypothetical protein